MHIGAGDVAVVTGAASGIGLALARACAERGATVLMADLDTPDLEAAVAAVDGHAVGVATDVTDPEQVAALVSRAGDHGGIDLLCANAGVPGHPARLWETPLADWRWVIDVNLWGVVHLLHAALPGMVERGRGHVVTTASIAAWSAGGAMAPYAATKHAVLALSEALYRELAGSGSTVGVTVVCPGAVATAFNERTRWPDRLGVRPVVREDAVAAETVRMLTTGMSAGVDPASVAEAALAGVADGRFVVSTDPDWVEHAALARVELVAGGVPALMRHPADRAT